MAYSLFPPRKMKYNDIENKRAAIASVYSEKWALSMPWYQVLAVYNSLRDRGAFIDLSSEQRAIILNFDKKALKQPKKRLTDDGVQISMFDKGWL